MAGEGTTVRAGSRRMLRAGVVLGILLRLGSQTALAQQQVPDANPEPSKVPDAYAEPPEEEGWEFVVAPYFISSTMSGTVGVADQSAEVDASPSDVFNHLQFGMMVYFEAHNPIWAFTLDGIYMDLGQSATIPQGTVDAGVKQGMVMAAAYRRITPWAEGMVGVQLNALGASLDGPGVDQSRDQTWVDPVIGGRLGSDMGRWNLSVQGDVGGFGVGSTFAWQLVPTGTWRATRNLDVILAYRIIGLDYTTGSGATEFRYDMTTYGPQLGFGFRF
jgi:hypothetical protein